MEAKLRRISEVFEGSELLSGRWHYENVNHLADMDTDTLVARSGGDDRGVPRERSASLPKHAYRLHLQLHRLQSVFLDICGQLENRDRFLRDLKALLCNDLDERACTRIKSHLHDVCGADSSAAHLDARDVWSLYRHVQEVSDGIAVTMIPREEEEADNYIHHERECSPEGSESWSSSGKSPVEDGGGTWLDAILAEGVANVDGDKTEAPVPAGEGSQDVVSRTTDSGVTEKVPPKTVGSRRNEMRTRALGIAFGNREHST